MTWLPKNKILCSNIEPPGCFNTGMAPTVVHKCYPDIDIQDMYLVGCESDVRDRNTRVRACAKLSSGGYVMTHTFTGNRVYVYRNSRLARLRYERLCTEVREAHDREARELRALRAKAWDGDIAAVLTLGLEY